MKKYLVNETEMWLQLAIDNINRDCKKAAFSLLLTKKTYFRSTTQPRNCWLRSGVCRSEVGCPTWRRRHRDHRLLDREERQVRKLGPSSRGSRNSTQVHRTESGKTIGFYCVYLELSQNRLAVVHNWLWSLTEGGGQDFVATCHRIKQHACWVGRVFLKI